MESDRDRLAKAEALIAFMSEQPMRLTAEGQELLMSMLALARKGLEAERLLREALDATHLHGHEHPTRLKIDEFLIQSRQAQYREHDAYSQLEYLWSTTGSCPCGARRESPSTHPHVAGCPTARAIAALKGAPDA